MNWSNDDEEEQNDEPRELPEAYLSEVGPCVTCGKPDQEHACFCCGKPVCMAEKYMDDSDCGGWIMDWWSSSAFDLNDGNEFWCQACLQR